MTCEYRHYIGIQTSIANQPVEQIVRKLMTFDSVIEKKVGVLGRWQLLLFLFVSMTVNLFPVGLIPQLANLNPSYICTDSRFQDWTYEAILNMSTRVAHLQQRFTETNNKTMIPDFKCQRYDLSGVDISTMKNVSVGEKQQQILAFASASNLSLQSCDGHWVFDSENAPFRMSLIESFQMVCHRWVLIPNTAVFFIAGRGIGMVTGGHLGDKLGRKTVVCVAFPLSAISAMMAFVCTSPSLLFLLRFCVGSGIGLGISSANVYYYEITNHRHRNTFSVMDSFTYIVGMNVFLVASYLMQDWRWLHLIYGVHALMGSLLVFLLLPESPRWLVARGRSEEALLVIRKAVLMNGGSVEVANSISQADLVLTSDVNHANDKQSSGFRQLAVFFVSPKSLKRWLPLSVVWIVIGEVYYGMSFYGVRLQGNPYLIFLAMSYAGVPSIIVGWILYEKFDRKRPLIGLMLFTLVCTVGALVAKITQAPGLIVVIFAVLVTSATATLFGMVYLITPEVFPTLYRANALGFLAAICRLGVISAMFAERLEGNWPLAIFSVTLAVATTCSFLLPQGNYKSLQEGSLESTGERCRSEAPEEVAMMRRGQTEGE